MENKMDKAHEEKSKKYTEVVHAYHNLFRSVDGDLVLTDLMKTHGILSNIYSGDINKMLIREGERNVVLRILHLLKVDINEINERIRNEF